VSQPLIVTLHIDAVAQAFYEDLRCRHFPPARNLIPAHLTLFHHLPDEAHTHQTLSEAATSTLAFQLSNPTPRSIGRGVAIFFDSPPLNSLHSTLSTLFEADLIPQDRQRLRPHIVVQNKVTPETARQTLTQLPASLIEPRALGLTIWRYLGGPWEHLTDIPFSTSPPER
jgi:hypothetical protein